MRTAAVGDGGPRLLRRRDPMPRRRPRRRTVAMVLRSALQATLLVGVPLSLVGWVALSSYFLVEGVSVRTGERVAEAWAESSLRPVLGEHILTLSLADVEGPLADHPWIASVEVTKELPRHLVVSVVEREPAAVWLREGEAFYLDPQGSVIAATGDEELATLLPNVEWLAGEPVPVEAALALVEELRGLRPAWAAAVDRIQILADGDYRLELATTDYAMMVRAGTLADVLPRLDLALEEIGNRSSEVGVVDLRLSRRVVIRTGATAPRPTNTTERRAPVETEEG